MAEKDTKDTGAVGTDRALVLQAEVAEGAKLPQVIAAALSIARRNLCQVRFRWEKHDIVVNSGQTYQSVQRDVQRLLKPTVGTGRKG